MKNLTSKEKKSIIVDIQYNEYIVKRLHPRRNMRMFDYDMFADLLIAVNNLTWLYDELGDKLGTEHNVDLYYLLKDEAFKGDSKYTIEEQKKILKKID